MQKLTCFCFAFAVLAVGNGGVVQQAHARWNVEYTDAPYNKWFAQQHNKLGTSCCDYADAHAVYDAYIKQGKWYVPIDGAFHEIQPYQLLDGPNPTGHAVIWYLDDETLSIFCFSPGPLY